MEKIQKNLLSQIPKQKKTLQKPAWMYKLGLLTRILMQLLQPFTSQFLAQVSEVAGLCFFFSSAFPFCTFSSNSSTSSFKSRFLSACGNINSGISSFRSQGTWPKWALKRYMEVWGYHSAILLVAWLENTLFLHCFGVFQNLGLWIFECKCSQKWW